MATGTGDYTLSLVATALTIIILFVFSSLKIISIKFTVKKTFSLVFSNANYDNVKTFESMAQENQLTSESISISKKDDNLQALMEVTATGTISAS